MGYAPEPAAPQNATNKVQIRRAPPPARRASGYADKRRLSRQNLALAEQAKLSETDPALPQATPGMLRGAESLLKIYCTIAHHATIDGTDRIPDGPVVFVANHWSDADGFVLFSTLPRSLDQITVVANGKIATSSVPTLWLMKQFGAILTTVDESKGSKGDTIRQAVATLRAGRSVLFFPQGAVYPRNATHTPSHTGFAVAAGTAGVPIVPLFVDGTDEAWPPKAPLPKPGARVHVTVGTVIEPSEIPELPAPGTAEQVDANGDAMIALRDFAAGVMRGVFAMDKSTYAE